MGFNLTVCEMNPDLFACRYMESIASQTDHFGNTFVHKNVALNYDVQKITADTILLSIRNGIF